MAPTIHSLSKPTGQFVNQVLTVTSPLPTNPTGTNSHSKPADGARRVSASSAACHDGPAAVAELPRLVAAAPAARSHGWCH